ncbi:MAG: LysR substrate-binding domain-containing protein, partial [Hyphomicrobiaceae bacterium]
MAFRLPPLTAVREFEAAARHLSFKAAAEELHVSPSAISHGVQTLEAWLGATLFERDPRGLSLTDDGMRLFEPVRRAFEGLARATDAVPGRKAEGTLSVSVAPTFGSRWLIPRLVRFTERYPDITVMMDTERTYVDLPSAGIDLAIRMAGQTQPGGTWLRLVRESFVPVCSPAFLAGARGASATDILTAGPLIHVTSVSEDWNWWFSRNGLAQPATPLLSFDTIHLAIDAAIGGLGIALGRKPIIDGDVAAGRLVQIGGPP